MDIIVGEERLKSADTRLQTAVEEFNITLAHFSHGVGFRTLNEVLGISSQTRITNTITGLRQDLSIVRGPPEDVPTGLNPNFMVPYPRNANFTGRKNLLTRLCEKLSDTAPSSWNHRVALYGLGGVGKTQLALEYVYSHKQVYERIYWISAVSEATVFAGFQEIAQRTRCVPTTLQLTPSDIAKRVLEWLSVQESWLLVLDNLDEIEVIGKYLPDESEGGHTLITTRNSHCDHIPAEGLKVSDLEIGDAIQLLLLRSGIGALDETPEAKAEAAQIVKELGYLALAIEQAAAYIREASHDIFKFLASYRKDRKVYYSRPSKGNRLFYTYLVSTTWHLSFQQIENNNKDASILIRLLSFLNPDGILTDFLVAGKEGLDAETGGIVSDELRFNEAMAELERFSLIGRQADINGGERLTIHRLVQTVIKDEMPPELRATLSETMIQLCLSAFPDSEYSDNETRSVKRRFQGQIVISLSSIPDINSRELGVILVRIGEFLRDDGNYRQAIELLENAVKILDRVGGSHDPDLLWAMNALGWAYDVQGRWTEASTLRENVLQNIRTLHGESDYRTLSAMSNLALTYSQMGRWDDAIKLQEVVLKSRINLLGEDHPDTLMAMANLASTYWKMGRWDDAIKLQEVVLKSRINLLGEDHPDTLTAMANLASIYWNMGRWDDAIKLQEVVLKSWINLLGEDHPDTLRAMANLASTYSSQGRWNDAIKLQEVVLKSQINLLGEDHPDTLRTMANLALTYSSQGRWGDAIKLQEVVLKSRINLLGEDHPDTLLAMTNLAASYLDETPDEASILLEKSYKGGRKVLGEEHPETLQTLSWLAYAYHQNGKLDESISLLEKAVEAMKRVEGENHPDTVLSTDYLESWRKEKEDNVS